GRLAELREHSGPLFGREQDRLAVEKPAGRLSQPWRVSVVRSSADVVSNPRAVTVPNGADEAAGVTGQPRPVSRGGQQPVPHWDDLDGHESASCILTERGGVSPLSLAALRGLTPPARFAHPTVPLTPRAS